MYRIPMTSEGAFRSNWETAANPMAGAPPGRLGGWWVSETPQVPRPGVVEWGAPGRGVVPAVPTLRPTWPPHEGHVLTERTVRWVTDMPSTVSGATSSCRFRERPATLPRLSETSSYRSAFRTFTRWCAGRQLQPWPASSQTVSDHLRWRAESCGSQTISQARRAISHTHRTAGRRSRSRPDHPGPASPSRSPSERLRISWRSSLNARRRTSGSFRSVRSKSVSESRRRRKPRDWKALAPTTGPSGVPTVKLPARARQRLAWAMASSGRFATGATSQSEPSDGDSADAPVQDWIPSAWAEVMPGIRWTVREESGRLSPRAVACTATRGSLHAGRGCFGVKANGRST